MPPCFFSIFEILKYKHGYVTVHIKLLLPLYACSMGAFGTISKFLWIIDSMRLNLRSLHYVSSSICNVYMRF